VASRHMNKGESLFEQYLARWGYIDYDYERDDLNPPKKPDYLIRTGGREVVAEVESFQTKGLFEGLPPETIASQSLKQALKPIRGAITHGAEQLKGIDGRPLVVVLVNPEARPLPLDPAHLISAMYGDLEFTGPADQPLSGKWHVERNGRLYRVNEQGVAHGNHEYISAIAVVRVAESVRAWADAWWDEHSALYESPAAAIADIRAAEAIEAPKPTVTLDVFETLSEHCVRLPASVFAHEGDRRWGVVAPGQYGLLGEP